MSWFQRNVISASIAKSRSDKLKDAALRDAKKRIANGELTDSHDLALYLSTIDERYAHLKTDISQAMQDENYAKNRDNKVVKTRQLLEFFSQEDAELRGLYELAAVKAKEAGLTNGLKGHEMTSIDLTKLQASFEKLERDEA